MCAALHLEVSSVVVCTIHRCVCLDHHSQQTLAWVTCIGERKGNAPGYPDLSSSAIRHIYIYINPKSDGDLNCTKGCRPKMAVGPAFPLYSSTNQEPQSKGPVPLPIQWNPLLLGSAGTLFIEVQLLLGSELWCRLNQTSTQTSLAPEPVFHLPSWRSCTLVLSSQSEAPIDV